MLKVYGFSRVNEMARGNTRDLRVLWALEEMGLPHEIAGLDHPNHDLDSPAYRAVNPFGQVPAIDDDGVVVTESGAILLYLARKSGKLMPRDLAGEAQVLRWSVAALNTIEVPVLTLWFVDISGGKGSKPSEALRAWAAMRLKELDGWLADRQFIATDDFTVADILMSHVLGGGTDPALLKPHATSLHTGRAAPSARLGRRRSTRTMRASKPGKAARTAARRARSTPGRDDGYGSDVERDQGWPQNPTLRALWRRSCSVSRSKRKARMKRSAS